MLDSAPAGPRPLVISHAACKGHAPENTLAGIRKALELGVDAIEIDVRATADGVPVLLHDASVDRTTDGSGQITALTLREAKLLDAGARSHDGRFAGERIPALREVIELTSGHALLVIEIKQRGVEPLVAQAARQLHAVDDVMVWCFQSEVVAEMRRIAPEIPCGHSFAAGGAKPTAICSRALLANAQAVVPEYSLIDDQFMQAALRHGLRVYAWTVDTAEGAARQHALGVDGICTNFPDLLRGGRSGATPASAMP